MAQEFITVVRNIPKQLTIVELRNFFCIFIETNKISVFHYLNRSQSYLNSILNTNYDENLNCCFVKVNNLEEFKKKYNKIQWRDSKNQAMEYLCLIEGPFEETELLIKHDTRRENMEKSENIYEDIFSYIKDKSNSNSSKYLTRKQKKTKEKNEENQKIEEFYPPTGLPNGNVGTSKLTIKKMINKCKLPATTIQKLGICETEFTVRKYGEVHFNYPGEGNLQSYSRTVSPIAPVMEYSRRKSPERKRKKLNTSPEAEDYFLEYEAPLSPRLFENELELTWEKGGSGLVFYTDEYRADSLLDADEKHVEDWSVLVDNREADEPEEASTIQTEKRHKKKRKHFFDDKFFNVLEKYGWTAGSGLGKHNQGIPEPITLETCVNRQGIGYLAPSKARRASSNPFGGSKEEEPYLIPTIFDPDYRSRS